MSRPPLPTQTLYCSFCANYFAWTPKHPSNRRPLYCTHTCKKGAQASARRLRGLMVSTACPTPAKRTFDNGEDVARWLAAHPDRTSGNRPYKCVCGDFHLGRITRADAASRGLLVCQPCRDRFEDGISLAHDCDRPGVCPCVSRHALPAEASR